MRLDVRGLIGLGRVESVAVSPDGRWLAVAVVHLDEEAAKYRSAIYRVPVDGGTPERLLHGGFDDKAPCFRHDGALGFLSDRTPDCHGFDEVAANDARRQVWLWEDGETPQIRPLTDEPLGVTAFRFARAADRLVVLAPVLPGVAASEQRAAADACRRKGPTALHYREMPVRSWDHWLPAEAPHFVAYDGDGQQRRDLTPDADREYRDAEWDLSADGQRLVTTFQTIGAFRLQISALAVHDLLQGTRQLLGHDDRTWHASPQLAPDGQRVAVQRGQMQEGRCGPRQLWLYDLVTAEARAVAADWDRWPAPVGWADAHTVLVTAADEGATPVFRVALGSGAVRAVTGSEASHGSVSVHRGVVYGIRHGTLQAPEAFRVPVEGGHVELLTALSGRAGLSELAEVEDITVPASDGGSIPCRLVRPIGADGPLPTLVWIHGGPIGQWGDTWHWRWNPLVMVAEGYQVALPEPRGSVGRGQEWVEDIWGNVWGDRCFADVMEVTDALTNRPDVDEGRMAAMGGSFGGYMTNWIGTQTDRFRCLVTHASVFSYPTFHGTTDNPAYWAHMLGAHPYGGREELDRYSPDRHVEGWRSPTLVLHGERDYRVPISEALSLFEALQLHGVESQLTVFPDENHWILRPNNIVAWYDTVVEFLGRHLSVHP